MKMTIYKDFEFHAAHKLEKEEWEEIKNKEVYQNCFNVHGHTYKLRVGVSGRTSDAGWVINFKNLKDVVNKVIIEELDHKYLNDLFTEITTVENLAIIIWDALNIFLSSKKDFSTEGELSTITLEYIGLWETPASFVEIRK